MGETSLEWLIRTPRWLPKALRYGIAILRLHPDGDGYGGAYNAIAVAQFNGRRVTLRGLLSREPFTFAQRRAIAALLREEGVLRVDFERKRGIHRMKTVTR